MIDVSAWEQFNALGTIIIFLGAVVFGGQRLGLWGKSAPAPSANADAPGFNPEIIGQLAKIQERLASIEKDLIEVRLERMAQFVRRDDYVQQITVLGSKVDSLAEALASLRATFSAAPHRPSGG